MKTTNIYVLSDGNKFYIGKADNVRKRYKIHFQDAFNPNSASYDLRKSRWMRSYGSIETAREYIYLLYSFWIPKSLWQIAEIKHIAYYRRKYGYDRVTNATDGGDGGPNISGEDHYASHITDEEIEFIKSRDDLSPNELAKLFDTTAKYIRKIRRGESRTGVGQIQDRKTYYPTKIGEDNYNSKLTWYEVFLFRMNFRPHGKGKASREYALNRLGISYQMSSYIYHNRNWYDENWDPQSHSYIGPPHNWEESWGDWSK